MDVSHPPPFETAILKGGGNGHPFAAGGGAEGGTETEKRGEQIVFERIYPEGIS